MRQLTGVSFILAIFLILTSCSNKQYQMLFQQKKTLADSAYQSPAETNAYRIRPQDILQVRNLQDAKYLINTPASPEVRTGILTNSNTAPDERNFQVDDDGSVILPAIGRIKVAGYTRLEAQQLIEETYRKNVLVNPIIELKIVNLKVIVYGEIKSPGSQPLLKDHTTLVEMIGQAGGLTERSNETNVKIIRGTERRPKVIEVDLSSIESINDPKAVLQNGDIIYISQNKRAVRNDNYQNFSSGIFQPLLLLVNTVLVVFALVRR